MTVKLFGAVLIIVACGGFGAMIAHNHRREVKTLEQFISALNYMYCELQYRLTPLPALCRQVSSVCTGDVKKVFLALSDELNNQIFPDVDNCMRAVLEKRKDIPKLTKKGLESLGKTLGRFDAEGQQRAIDTVRYTCSQDLDIYSKNQEQRLRSYKTLGLCAGAAMVILFI